MSAALSAPHSADVILIGAKNRAPVQIEIVDDATLAAEEQAALAQPEADDRFDRNLAEDMDSTALAALAGSLLEGIEADLQSRAEWEETANKAARYLGVKLEDPTTSVSSDGTIVKAVATCMLEATIKLWSVARGELLPVGGPVKVRRDQVPTFPEGPAAQSAGIAPGQPQPGQPPQPPTPPPANSNDVWSQDQLAEALATDLNHFLTQIDKEYYPDYSKMILSRAVIGNAFRKVYRCPLRRRPASVWVKAQDLIVSNDCAHLSGAGRVTERIRLRQATMRRLQASGHYIDIPLVRPSGKTTNTEIAIADTEGIAAAPTLPEDFEHLVYECYCEVGSGTASSLIGDLSRLDRDETGKRPGYPLPYRVTIDEDSRMVLEIRRDWKKGDTDHRRRRRYVKYGFIPGFGFYDFGLIHLVGNPTQVATMVQRAITDATLFSNFPAWLALKGPGSRQANTVIRPNPGEVTNIDAAGAQRIQDAIMPLPFKADVAGAMALVSKAEGDVRRIAGVLEIPIGEGRMGNVPVGTMMSYIESISQVPGAVHKDDHIAQQEEFDLLRELFAEDPAALIQGNKSPARRWQAAEEILDPHLVPAADPNTPSQIHRIAKLQAIITAAGMPQFNMPEQIPDQRKLWEELTRTLVGGDGQQFTKPPMQAPPPPPPDPRVVAAQINAQSKQQQTQGQLQAASLKHDEKMQEISAEGQQRELDRESAELRSAMQAHSQTERTTHDTVNAALDRQQQGGQHAQQQDAQREAQSMESGTDATPAPSGI